MIDDRYITHFSEHLVPEAFARPHSAYLVEHVEDLATGPGGFDRWVDDLLELTLAYRYPAGHRPVRIIIVEGADGIRWRWDGDLCCPPQWMVERVRDEALPIPEPWVFAIELAWPDPSWEVWDPAAGEVIELAQPVWLDTTWTATWYAEGRGRSVARTVAGAVQLDYDPDNDTDRELGREPRSTRSGLPKIFHRTLFSHPARKDFPLRRR